MQIRRAQMETLDAYMARTFEDRLVADVRTLFPSDYESLGEAMVRTRLRQGCADAEAQGIAFEADIARYTYLMFLLAPDFAGNPRYPWVTAILDDESLHPGQKLDALYDRTRQVIESSGAKV